MPTTRRAADVAAEISEQVRALNYATLPADGFPGLTWVADVYEVLAALREAANRLQQSVMQSGSFLAHAADKGDLINSGTFPEAPDPDTAIAQACAGLHEAERLAAELAQILDRSAQAIAWIAHTDDGQDDEGA